jgi:phosphoglycolate phosphatase
MVHAVFYDLDGTLIDSSKGIELAARHAVERHCPERTLPELRPFIGPSIRRIFESALGGLDAEDLDRLEAFYRSAYDSEACLISQAFPGIQNSLKLLMDVGVRQFVVTNKPQLPTKRIIESFGWSRYFVEVVSPDSQSPRVVRKADAVKRLMVKHSLQSRQCVFVGDSTDDAEAALDNGIHFIYAAYGYGRGRPAGDVAYQSCTRPEDLTKVLNNWLALRDGLMYPAERIGSLS